MPPLVGDQTLSLLRQAARFTEARHEVLAANVAHVDTPEYERRDLDVEGFREALRRFVASRRESLPASHGTETTQLPVLSIDDVLDSDFLVPRTDTERHLRFHDAAVRSVETEMTELVRNSLLHAQLVELLNAQFGMLQAVISERG